MSRCALPNACRIGSPGGGDEVKRFVWLTDHYVRRDRQRPLLLDGCTRDTREVEANIGFS